MAYNSDQFFTKDEVAAACVEFAKGIIRPYIDIDKAKWIEPSAGNGAFVEHLPREYTMALDISPGHLRVVKWDFFDTNFQGYDIAIGNPPFGKRSSLATRFVNHAAKAAHTVAFILPISFKKYQMQKQVSNQLRLIAAMSLEKNSFIRPDGKPHLVNTEFQIWTRHPDSIMYRDLRLTEGISLTHSDFELHQYNATKDALKAFDNDWDFAVPSQGWQDYSRREFNGDDCEKHKHWMLIKANSPDIKQVLLNIDYDKLAEDSAIIIPGFRKRDLINHYNNL